MTGGNTHQGVPAMLARDALAAMLQEFVGHWSERVYEWHPDEAAAYRANGGFAAGRAAAVAVRAGRAADALIESGAVRAVGGLAEVLADVRLHLKEMRTFLLVEVPEATGTRRVNDDILARVSDLAAALASPDRPGRDAMSRFTMRVRKMDARTDEELRALLEDEAVSRGLDPSSIRYQTRSAYRLDSGTHIDYAFDVDVWT